MIASTTWVGRLAGSADFPITRDVLLSAAHNMRTYGRGTTMTQQPHEVI